ncbi:hypothetical protein L6Q82_35415, partial [Burkholderia cenocepacia]|uniref:hypothetical protein n=1 Tax=Burkholderia cenocepacia TaxID=95486 RepID=UPI001F44FBF2
MASIMALSLHFPCVLPIDRIGSDRLAARRVATGTACREKHDGIQARMRSIIDRLGGRPAQFRG